MTALEIGRPRRGIGFNRNIIYVILIALFIAGIYFLAPKFEWHKPQIKVTPNTDFIGIPTIELIADDPYISFGGCGLIVYKPSPDAATSGIKIGDYFFPGYKSQTKDPNVYIAFFAHPYNVPPEEKAVLVATDKAGNTRQM